MTHLKQDSFTAYQFLSGATISPDGAWCTYHVHKSNLEENRYDSDLWAFNMKTEKFGRLTTSKRVGTHVWLPGEKPSVLYPSAKDPAVKKAIEEGEPLTVFYRLDLNGGESEEYMRVPFSVSDIKAIDETHFILKANYHPNTADWPSLDEAARKSKLADLKEEGDYEVVEEIPFWTNGGSFTSRSREQLFLYDKTSNKAEPITTPDISVDFFEYDSKENIILYTAIEIKGKMPLENRLFVYHLSGGKHELLIDGGGETWFAAPRSDGKIVVLFNDMKTYGLNQNAVFYLLDPKTGEKVPFAESFTHSIGNSVGSDCRYGRKRAIKADGDVLYFIMTKAHSAYLARLDASGTLEVLTESEISVDDFDIVNGKMTAILMKGLDLEELYTVSESGECARVTDHNTWIGETYDRSEPESVTFKNQNGIEIQGWVMKPIGYESGKKYPGILDIHGGPKTVYGTVFYHEMQYWANEGFFVFFCNPTGSDGGGDEFADIRGKYGTVDYDDLMQFTDVVLESHSDLDQENLFVTGGSYGGYMTNWIIGHTNRFKAAASQRSIANWTTEFGVTDIGYFFVPDQAGADPWTGYDKLWDSSPLKYADRIKTPTLLIHSDQDYRCWIPEAYQFFTALKYFGVEARLCVFKGENHELSRSGKPKHRIRRLEEITNWFKMRL
jgi:dipeptidyl aminopeptidase/acylaminoacyl peptidase